MQFNLRPTGVEIIFIYSDYKGRAEEKRKDREKEDDDDNNGLQCFKSNMLKNF
jgi:hypothetical protein